MSDRGCIAVVGPSPAAQGGIARVIAQALTHGLPPWAPRLVPVASFRGGGGRAKATAWAGGLARFVVLCALDRPRLAYVHIAAGMSTLRKASFILVARAVRVPVLLHVHPATFVDQLERPGATGRLARWCTRAAAGVVVLSESFVDRVLAVAPSVEVTVVPNAPDLSEDDVRGPDVARVPGRVLFVGALLDDKGVDVLVDAVARIAADTPALRLALVGAGPDERALLDRAAAAGVGDRVEALGWLGPEALATQYASAAVFVLPSRTEGLPLALLEAMWHGLPCVGTDVGAVPEALGEGAGVVVPPEDAEALAGAIHGLLADPASAAALAAAGAARVRSRYSPVVHRAAVERLLLAHAGAIRSDGSSTPSEVAGRTASEARR